MAKKRKIKDPIIFEVVNKDVSNKPPKCFGCYEEYCLQDLCGSWFEQCKKASVECHPKKS